MRWWIGAKFCTVVSIRPQFITPIQNFGGLPPKNFRGQKHAKFSPISDDFKVWRQVPLEQIKIFKIGQVLDQRDSSHVRRIKSSELWYSNLGDLDVKLYPPKAPFSENLRCCTPKFLHVLENGQVLLAIPQQGWEPPLQFFFKEGSKIGLKFSITVPITLAVVEVAP